MRKKSQISVFVILGILIIILIALFAVSQHNKKKKELVNDADTARLFSEISSKVEKYVEDCLEFTTSEIIEKLWITEAEDISYYIDNNFLLCIDEFRVFEVEGYEISYGEFKQIVEINPKTVYIDMDFPINISKNEQKAEIEKFVYTHELQYDVNSDNKILNLEDVKDYEMVFENVVYKKEKRFDPLILATYIVKVNLNDKDIRFEVTPPRDVPGVRTNFMKTSSFLNLFNLQVAINADGWNRKTDQSLMGLASWHDDIYGSPGSSAPSIFFDEDSEMFIAKNKDERPDEIWDAVSGFSVIVENAEIKDSVKGLTKREPRTSLGLDEDNNILMFIIVDGRQSGHSAGCGLETLAEFQLEKGATLALNMDGGGSSTLAIQGKYDEGVEGSAVVNSPSDEIEFEQICPGNWDDTGNCVDEYDNPLLTIDGDAIPFSGDERIVGSHLGIYALPWN